MHVRRFSFGPYAVDASAGELHKNGHRIEIPGKSFEALVALLERPHELVTRQELQQRLWPDGVSVDFENSLNSAVNRLRDALRDGARNPKYIETLHRRGYRFIAPVEQVLIDPPRLAVLPFENLGSDPEQNFFGDSIADGLITELGNVNTLRVISRQSVLHLKGTRKTLAEIAGDLKVDFVVEGCVLVSEDSIRITAQLVQTTPEQHLWSKAYSCRIGEILTLQGEIAREIAKAGQLTLSTTEVERLSRQHPVHPEAQVDYLKARYYLGQVSREGLHKGLQHLHLALEKDPTHAPAYAHMASCYLFLGFWGHLPGPEAYPRAKKAALRAIALDDTLGFAHSVLGSVSWLYDWNLAACEAETLRAIELNPSDESAHVSYAVFLAIIAKDRAKAVAEAKLALDLDPLSLYANISMGWIHLFVGEYGWARQRARTTLDLFPDALQAWYVLGWSELMHSQFDAAVQAFEKAAAISPDALSIGYLGHAHARAGHLEAATSLLSELLTRVEREYVPAKSLICVYAGLGERTRVVHWLEKAYLDRDSQLFFMGGAVPMFGPLSELIQTWIRERLPHL